jgi:oligoendopeptidase F
LGGGLLRALHTNPADAAAERRYFAFLDTIAPAAEVEDQRLKERLLASDLRPARMEVPLRGMRTEAQLFRSANVALFVEESKLGAQYDKIVGAQTVLWDGREVALPRLRTVFAGTDRARRERAWWLARERQLADRPQLDALWQQLLALRERVAANAGHADYRSFIWQSYRRFDYTPADCARFHDAIEAVVVPAATRVYERRQRRLGVTTLRPWDLVNGEWGPVADPPGRQPLAPYRRTSDLLGKSAAILKRVDSHLGAYFGRMIAEDLLDVENRVGKAPGAYCTFFGVSRRPYIFMNAVGQHDDVQTLLHEAGHAFHAFEAGRLPYFQQLGAPMEFNEVASMAMELLAAPYLAASQGGFYDAAGTARARIEHLEQMVLFWPYMAVVDAFQHWAYTHPADAADARRCDAEWQTLWQRFIPGVDWSGLEAEQVSGWQRRLHIFRAPYYYVEYGLAQLGAAQVWRGALQNHPRAVERYRKALALGGTASLPELYATAGARFAFDAATLEEAVKLIERTIGELERGGV